ncbi:peptidase M4 family protein, partial [candidate division KSB1 bacterium]
MWSMNLKNSVRFPLFIALLIVTQADVTFGMLRKSAGRAEGVHQQSAVSSLELQRISERLRPRLADYQSRYEHKQTGLTIANQRLQFSDSVDRHPTLYPFDVRWHENNNTPVFIRVEGGKGGLQKQAVHLPAKDAATKFLQENNQLFRLDNPAEELVPTLEKVDALGKTHVAFNQYYQGIPVWGHDIVVHLDEYHQVYALNARYSPTPTALVNKPGISSSTAIQIASADLEKTTRIEELPSWGKSICDYHEPQAQKYVWIEDKSQRSCLVWHVRVRPNLRDHWYYFVDAQNGAILEKYNATNSDGIAATAIATDLNGVEQTVNSYWLGVMYYLIDASRPIWQENQPDVLNDPRGALLTLDAQNHDLDQDVSLYHVISAENTWTDPAAVSSHCNMGVVFDYFYNTHGRRAIDDNGSTVISLIHVTDNGKSMDNAYWNGALMLYGDGDLAYKPLAGGLDVAAHEMAHGVIQHTVGLEYKFQSGALNESLADVFGVMVDREDWRLGEDVAKTDYYPSGSLRDM